MMAMSNLVGREITEYSRCEPGEPRNHHRAVRFDVTDGFIGITAFEDKHGSKVADRVLLSPKQFTSLLAFIGAAKKHRRSVR